MFSALLIILITLNDPHVDLSNQPIISDILVQKLSYQPITVTPSPTATETPTPQPTAILVLTLPSGVEVRNTGQSTSYLDGLWGTLITALAALFGTILGGFVTYRVNKSIENMKWEKQIKDRRNKELRKPYIFFIDRLDPLEQALADALAAIEKWQEEPTFPPSKLVPSLEEVFAPVHKNLRDKRIPAALQPDYPRKEHCKYLEIANSVHVKLEEFREAVRNNKGQGLVVELKQSIQAANEDLSILREGLEARVRELGSSTEPERHFSLWKKDEVVK